MERIDQTYIAEAILTAPGWARVGLTAPSAWTRKDAAQELARTIIDAIQPSPPTDSDQIGLAL